MASDPKASPVGESTASQLQAYIQNLPQLLNITAAQTLPVGQQTQNAQNVLAPQQQQLQNQLFSQYAPQLYAAGNQLNAQQAQAGVSQASNLLGGSGGQLLQQAIAADQATNPQFYAARQAAGNQLTNLLGSINLNGLSGSERAEVERSNAQQDAQRGILNSPSQTATTQNAMQFGSALQAKRNALAQAIGTATSFLPSSQSSINSFAVGTGQATNQANPGASQFLGIGSNANNASQTNAGLGGNLLGNINQSATNAANINANRRDVLDRANETIGSLPT